MTKQTNLAIVLMVGVGAGAILATAVPWLSGSSKAAEPVVAATTGESPGAPTTLAFAPASSPLPGLRDEGLQAGTSQRVEDVSLLNGTREAAGARAAAMERVASEISRPSYREVTIPAGTELRLTLDTSLATDTTNVEDAVHARLATPILVGGRTVVPDETPVSGYVTTVRRAAKVKGRAYLAMRFTQLRLAHEDEPYRITTRVWAREAPGTKKKDAAKIGIPAGVGALVGGILGGKKGVGIGAAVGGGAGTGVVLATRGTEVRVPRGSAVVVRLSAPVTVRIPA